MGSFRIPRINSRVLLVLQAPLIVLFCDEGISHGGRLVQAMCPSANPKEDPTRKETVSEEAHAHPLSLVSVPSSESL